MSSDTDTMQRYFAPKRFEGRFGWGRTRFLAEVESPDLRGLDHRVSGDWGPMYTVDLPVDRVFLIRYSEASGHSAAYAVSPPTVSIETPMQADARAAHPYVMRFIDAARGLQFRAFMAFGGEVQRVEVQRVHIAFDVPKLLFREQRRNRSAESRQSA